MFAVVVLATLIPDCERLFFDLGVPHFFSSSHSLPVDSSIGNATLVGAPQEYGVTAQTYNSISTSW
jgi:hypothetical protein